MVKNVVCFPKAQEDILIYLFVYLVYSHRGVKKLKDPFFFLKDY